MLKKISYLTIATGFLPLVVLAATSRTFEQLITDIGSSILQPIIYLLIALAGVYFLSGVLKYTTSGGEEAKRTEGAHMMWYGIVAIFVMLSVWGLVKVLVGTFDFEITPPDAPTISI